LSALAEGIIFDLDDTLVIEEPSAVKAFREVCVLAEKSCGVEADNLYVAVRESARSLWHASPARPYCVSIGISSWEGLWARFEGNDPSLSILRRWAPEYRQNTWNNALKKCGINDWDLADKLADTFFNNRRQHHVLFADALTCLEELSRLYPLALLTNGVPDLQREKIEATGIAKYFKQIVISGEAGFGKPDRRIYELALSRLGTGAESTWNIGDSLERDILGAGAAGIKTIWVNRRGATRDASIVPDLEMPDLSGLPDALQNYGINR
jgi:putative hydrolase of the HAD superfamily